MFGDIWLKTVIPFAKLKQRSEKYELYNEQIKFATVEDLIKLKKFAGRPVDKEDIYELKILGDRKSSLGLPKK